jgi:hypothetical protein
LLHVLTGQISRLGKLLLTTPCTDNMSHWTNAAVLFPC